MWATILLGAIGVLVAALLGLWIAGERGRLLRPSTRAWINEGGWRYVVGGDFFHAYVYGRWSDLYIGQSISRVFPTIKPDPHNLRWATRYHGKVIPTDLAKRLISVERDLRARDLEQIIPYPAARELVLQGPPDIAVYRCPCRMAREHPCEPLDVCMIVGQPFVDFVVEHHPDTARRITQQEAIALLEAEHKRGHIHAAYFKDVMLNRFYAICNCCACCCGGLEAMRRGVPMVTPSGFVAQIDPTECSACGVCEDACPFGAIHVNGGAMVDRATCMGCGVCLGQCPNGGIALVPDVWRGIKPLDVWALANS